MLHYSNKICFVLGQEIDEGSRNTSILHQVLLGEFIEWLVAEDINMTGVDLLATLLCPHSCLLSASCLVRHIADDRSQEVI